ncbi:MAG: hypothetical protein H0V80_01995 [Acidobacteria bacterium]|nr:hypothetical protein [Acidobacteriota bacterium]
MPRRLLLVFILSVALELLAFRYLNRDLLWLDVHARTPEVSALTRDTAEAALQRPRLSRRHLEALIAATDRDEVRGLQLRAFARLAARHEEDPDVLLRYADALRRARQFDHAERVYADLLKAAE